MLFRVARVDPPEDADESGYVEQTVEVALGPKATFKKGSVGRLTRRVQAGSLAPLHLPPRATATRKRIRQKPKSPPKRRTASGAKFLRLAREWKRQLDAGEAESQAAIARREGITRARVCQIMALLHLDPDTQRRVCTTGCSEDGRPLTERALRGLARSSPAAVRGQGQAAGSSRPASANQTPAGPS